MHNAVEGMLRDYACESVDEFNNALVEILQEVALLGLRDSGFLTGASLFGATALRVLHGLDRRCESLDFTLLEPDPGFTLTSYADPLRSRMAAFGFDCELKGGRTGDVVLQGNHRSLLQSIDAPDAVVSATHYRKLLKIPVNVDTAPVTCFITEDRFLQRPVPFPVPVVALPDAFAWKLHSLLAGGRSGSGLDWFDFAWYVISFPEVRLGQLEAKLRSTGDYTDPAPLPLDRVQFGLLDIVKTLDIQQAKREAASLLNHPSVLDDWSLEYFAELIGDIEAV